MFIVDGRCEACPGEPVYSMVGRCTNCGLDDVLLVFTEKHSSTVQLPCPGCACRELKSSRRASVDEITAVLSGV